MDFDATALFIKNTTFDQCKKWGSDLVAFNDYGNGCCEKCAKMRGRVYSISGKHKQFPELPEYVKTNGNFHEGCRCTMNLFWENVSSDIFYKGEKVNAIKSSQRPWTDDRDEREIKLYEDYLNRNG